MQQLRGHSITYRIAIGPQVGHSRLPSNSRYREHLTPTRSVKGKETTTDEEADRREELNQTAGKRKGMRSMAGNQQKLVSSLFYDVLSTDFAAPCDVIVSITATFQAFTVSRLFHLSFSTHSSVRRKTPVCHAPKLWDAYNSRLTQ